MTVFRHRRASWLIAIALTLLPAGIVRATDVQTAAGIVAVAERPARIAVFDIAAVDTLDSIGVRIDGLPSNLYLPELQALGRNAAPVGTIFEPDLEALSALQPDLVILGGRSSPKRAATEQVAPTIDMTMDGDDLLDQAKARLAAYGALFGRQAGAGKVEAELDAAVARARAAVAGKGRALIVMTNGPKITAYGIGSRFGWLHRSLDLAPAAADVDAAIHGEAISFEFIRAANPDWLLVIDRAAAIGSQDQNARATLDNALVAETTAWEKDQVVYLPAGDFYIAAGGARSMIRVFDAITQGFAKSP